MILNMLPTQIALTSASINGLLACTTATPTAVSVVWGRRDAGTDWSGWDGTNEWPAPQSTGMFSHVASPLTSNVTYYYRYACSNVAGTEWSDPVESFMTAEVTIRGTANGSEAGPVNGAFTVSRPATATDEDALVSYGVDETVADSATVGVDYTALAGTVTIPAGSAEAQIAVQVLQDYDDEPTETVRLVLTNGSYVVGSPSSATIGIASLPPRHVNHFEDFDAGDGGYTTENPQGMTDVWTYNGSAGVGGSGGWRVSGTQRPEHSQRLITPAIDVIGTSPMILEFDHNYDLPDGWDGAVVDISVNGGAFTYVPEASFMENGYTRTCTPTSMCELRNMRVFGGSSGGFITSVADLGSFTKGDTLRVQFRAAWDIDGGGSWIVDNVRLTQKPLPPSGALVLIR
jgi:hypothetical protein